MSPESLLCGDSFVDRYPLIPFIKPTIEPVSHTAGTSGYGEGFEFGTEPYSKRVAAYYYRFAGARVPRNGVVYVTNECGYWSRQKGDRTHLILAFDDEINAFRILDKIGSMDRDFSKKLAKFKSFSTNADAIYYAQKQAELCIQEREKISTLINSGADLF